MFAVDAHLDLSMNALEWNRDLRLPVGEINARERARGWTDKPDRGNATVAFPELRRGGFGLVVATQIGRFVAADNPLPGWHSPEQAWAQTQGQLAWYRAMEEAGELVQIVDRSGLDAHAWNTLLATRLETTQDRLAHAARRRDPAPFRTLLSGDVGVGGVYDLSRRCRAWLKGERFDPSHGGVSSISPEPR